MPAALSAPPARQTQRRMYATLPVDYEYNLAGPLIDVYHDLADERSQEPLLRTLVRLGIVPQGFQIVRKILELINRANSRGRRTFSFDADASFDYSHLFKCAIPPTLEFLRTRRLSGSVASYCRSARFAR